MKKLVLFFSLLCFGLSFSQSNIEGIGIFKLRKTKVAVIDSLVQNGGYLRAAEKLMFGEAFTPQEAIELGVASHVMPASEVEQYAFHRARQLAAKSPEAMRETKRLLKAPNADRLRQVMDEEIATFSRLMAGAHAREAITAFFEKRKPVFE